MISYVWKKHHNDLLKKYVFPEKFIYKYLDIMNYYIVFNLLKFKLIVELKEYKSVSYKLYPPLTKNFLCGKKR